MQYILTHSAIQGAANAFNVNHFRRFHVIRLLLVLIIMTGCPSYSKDLGSAGDPIEDACIIDGNILLRDDFDDLLRNHTSGQCRDIVQFSTFGAGDFFSGLHNTLV